MNNLILVIIFYIFLWNALMPEKYIWLNLKQVIGLIFISIILFIGSLDDKDTNP